VLAAQPAGAGAGAGAGEGPAFRRALRALLQVPHFPNSRPLHRPLYALVGRLRPPLRAAAGELVAELLDAELAAHEARLAELAGPGAFDAERGGRCLRLSQPLDALLRAEPAPELGRAVADRRGRAAAAVGGALAATAAFARAGGHLPPPLVHLTHDAVGTLYLLVRGGEVAPAAPGARASGLPTASVRRCTASSASAASRRRRRTWSGRGRRAGRRR